MARTATAYGLRKDAYDIPGIYISTRFLIIAVKIKTNSQALGQNNITRMQVIGLEP